MRTVYNILDGTDYPLEFLDELVTVSLRRAIVEKAAIDPAIIRQLASRVNNEGIRLKQAIKSHVFSISQELEHVIVRRYHTTLIRLLEQVATDRERLDDPHPLSEVYAGIANTLDRVLSFIETWYWSLLDLESLLPKPYLAATKEEVRGHLQITDLGLAEEHPRKVYQLISGHLREFTESDELSYRVSYRSAMYKKELVRKLAALEEQHDLGRTFSAIDELLIYLNFNSKAYLKLLREEIASMLDLTANPRERLERLHFIFKEFKHLPVKSGVIYNPNAANLQDLMKAWFEEEIGFLETTNRLTEQQAPASTSTKKTIKVPVERKIICNLSTDQLGLMLRAADDTKLIIPKSLSQVFKIVVPYLATLNKSELSVNGVRSNAYKPEEKDKLAAIDCLERMIRRIREY